MTKSSPARLIEPRKTFNHRRSFVRERRTWYGMLRRCLDPTNVQFKDYGGRGIKVCERWRKFENFIADMGTRPAGKTLDRFPNHDGHYEPGNCRWATLRQQQHTARRAVRGTRPTPIKAVTGKNAIDLSGKRFGRLVAVKATHRSARGILYWLCNCDCGNTRIARQDNLRAGLSDHCTGCPSEAIAYPQFAAESLVRAAAGGPDAGVETCPGVGHLSTTRGGE